MNIHLNLLPEERKRGLKRKKISWLIIRQELLVFFSVAVFLIILFCINFILDLQGKSLESEYAEEALNGEYKEIGKYEKIFEDENREIALLYSVQKNHFDWTNVLTRLSENVINDVKLKGIVSDDSRFSISGIANDRDTLLRFKSQIENSQCFSEMEIPLSDIVSKKNINFEAELKIEEECIKTKK
ncbi:MAG: Uncharacterized protein Athens071425_575 [Parcubacteria group bacterium Athens0714_25]|nr:MAG: Uncharacterized protein Athens071425_575 [Parcubacteria group bacterium Athens0714_25]